MFLITSGPPRLLESTLYDCLTVVSLTHSSAAVSNSILGEDLEKLRELLIRIRSFSDNQVCMKDSYSMSVDSLPPPRPADRPKWRIYGEYCSSARLGKLNGNIIFSSPPMPLNPGGTKAIALSKLACDTRHSTIRLLSEEYKAGDVTSFLAKILRIEVLSEGALPCLIPKVEGYGWRLLDTDDLSLKAALYLPLGRAVLKAFLFDIVREMFVSGGGAWNARYCEVCGFILRARNGDTDDYSVVRISLPPSPQTLHCRRPSSAWAFTKPSQVAHSMAWVPNIQQRHSICFLQSFVPALPRVGKHRRSWRRFSDCSVSS